MPNVLTIDPSGTGITGLYFVSEHQEEFYQCQSSDWKKHYLFIKWLVEAKQPNLIVFENTNFIKTTSSDMTKLLQLFGAIETLTYSFSLLINKIPVNQVKEIRKKLLNKQIGLANLTYQIGKGWFYQQQKISTHQLDAYLVWYLNSKKR